jgi:hypothetical protein
VRPSRGTPRKEWVFVGELVVESVKLIDSKEFRDTYAPRAVEADIPFPKPGEKAWIIEFKHLMKYEKPVKLEVCKDIKTSTSKKPLSDWLISGFTLIKPVDARGVIEAIRRKAEIIRPPSHEELVEELIELGKWLGFVVKKEEYTPDRLYRLDVVWTDAEGHAPLKAFEVEVSGDVDRALARLAHAFDKWRCEQLWLVVSDEARAERAKKLIQPMLEGSFARIKSRVKILGWKELHDTYISIKLYSELVKELSRR